jgi:hypothetical protein
VHLPRSFYASAPELDRIRQAALSRGASPDAVLHSVLARIAAFSPPSLRLPALVGTELPLNYFVASIAPSGGGKSVASSVAAELLPAPPELEGRDNLLVGTGEGLIESFLEKEDGVKVQVHHNAFLYVDEGETFARLGAREGTTLDVVIRSAFTGGALGQRNATASTSRRLEAGSYALGIVVGYQPMKAGQLLQGADGGTPQRFVWASAQLDPNDKEDYLAGQEWPQPFNARAYVHTGVVRFDHLIRQQIIEEYGQVIFGERQRPVLDSHEPVIRMRMATLLALLLTRKPYVAPEHWVLADTMYRTSRLVRRYVAEEVAGREAQEGQRQLDKARAVAVAQHQARESVGVQVKSTMDRVLTLLGRSPMGKGHLRQNMSIQQYAVLDEALIKLLRLGQIEQDPESRARLRLVPAQADLDDVVVVIEE